MNCSTVASKRYNMLRLQPIAVTFCFLISPLFSLPLILIEIFNRRNYAIWLFIIFISLIGFLFPPTGDLYRYYTWYYLEFKGIPLTHIADFYVFDYAWYTLIWILSNLNISFQFSLFISIFIQSTIVLFFLSKYRILDLKSSLLRFLLIICSFIFLGGLWGTLQNRFSVALSFYALSAYYMIEATNYKKSFFFIVLSSLTHFSFFLFSLLLIAFIPIKRFVNISTIIISTLLLTTVILSIGYYLASIGFDKAVYIVDATNWKENQSVALKTVYFLANQLPFIIFSIIILFSKRPLFFRGIFLYFLPIYISTLSMPDFNGRIQTIMLYFGWLFLISNLPYLRSIIVRLFVCLSVSSFCLSSLIFNRSIILGRYYRIAEPIYIILQQSYSTKWIEEHIDEGDIVKI